MPGLYFKCTVLNTHILKCQKFVQSTSAMRKEMYNGVILLINYAPRFTLKSSEFLIGVDFKIAIYLIWVITNILENKTH